MNQNYKRNLECLKKTMHNLDVKKKTKNEILDLASCIGVNTMGTKESLVDNIAFKLNSIFLEDAAHTDKFTVENYLTMPRFESQPEKFKEFIKTVLKNYRKQLKRLENKQKQQLNPISHNNNPSQNTSHTTPNPNTTSAPPNSTPSTSHPQASDLNNPQMKPNYSFSPTFQNYNFISPMFQNNLNYQQQMAAASSSFMPNGLPIPSISEAAMMSQFIRGMPVDYLQQQSDIFQRLKLSSMYPGFNHNMPLPNHSAYQQYLYNLNQHHLLGSQFIPRPNPTMVPPPVGLTPTSVLQMPPPIIPPIVTPTIPPSVIPSQPVPPPARVSAPTVNQVPLAKPSSVVPPPVRAYQRPPDFLIIDEVNSPNPGCDSTQKVCFCLKKPSSANLVLTCQRCKKIFHQQCLRIEKITEQEKQTFECPLCTLETMDPMHAIRATLSQEIVNFESFKDKIYQIKIRLEKHIELLKEDETGFEIRCLKLDGSNYYEISWPDQATLKVNDEKTTEFKPLMYNSCLKKRKDESLFFDIRSLKKAPFFLNIDFEIKPHNKETQKNLRIKEDNLYAVGVYIVKKLSVPQLISKIIAEQSTENTEETYKQKIVSLLAEANKVDAEIQIEKVSISLNDPYNLEKIRIPARGKYCRHAQCFSLDVFVLIMSNAQPRHWKCPLCKSRCFSLQIDTFLKNIIEKINETKQPVRELTFDKNGNYEMTVQEVARSDEEEEQESVEVVSKCLQPQQADRNNQDTLPINGVAECSVTAPPRKVLMKVKRK